MALIELEKTGSLAFVKFNRPEKRNAFTLEMFRELGTAFAEADDDDRVRCVVVSAAGPDTTTGLDLVAIAPAWLAGEMPFLEGMVDPWGVTFRKRTKPMVMAARGRCFTLGFELGLAADAFVAASDARFALKEVKVGIYPAGGGTFRFIQAAGWGNAMRYVLTGDELDAGEAWRLGLVQAVTEPGAELARAVELADRIASSPPLAVRKALASAFRSVEAAEAPAIETIVDDIRGLIATEDAAEAMAALVERREPVFRGQ